MRNPALALAAPRATAQHDLSGQLRALQDLVLPDALASASEEEMSELAAILGRMQAQVQRARNLRYPLS